MRKHLYINVERADGDLPRMADVSVEALPNGEFMVSDKDGGRVRVFHSMLEAEEHAVTTAAMLAARYASERLGIGRTAWDVEISPAKAPRRGDQ